MGSKVNLVIKWDEKAFEDFINIIDHISQNSPANALLVRGRIMKMVKSLPLNPKIFREDELKLANDGEFRVFSKDNIRVSYKIESKGILIARIRHSSQEPIVY